MAQARHLKSSVMTQNPVEAVSPRHVQRAICLLSQQCWCWGRDILRPEGNWLLEVGFERLEPPEKLKGRGSVYQLLLPDDRQLILRGFGVFFGQLGVGGVFLPRFEFIPRYTKLSKLDSPPWTTDHLPTLQPLDQGNRSDCARLTHDLVDWFAAYEASVIEWLGVAYRDKTLAEWNDGDNVVVAASEFSAAWRELKHQIGAGLEGLASQSE